MSPIPPFIALKSGVIIQTSQVSYMRPSRPDEEGAFSLIMSGVKQIFLDKDEGQKIYDLLAAHAASSGTL